jgi:hypothetical protein
MYRRFGLIRLHYPVPLKHQHISKILCVVTSRRRLPSFLRLVGFGYISVYMKSGMRNSGTDSSLEIFS